MRALLLLFAVTTCAADFPTPFNSGNDKDAKPMPAAEAVKLIKLPPGFKATVFAAEPDVQNPIACAWDSRGRLWIAENYTYADAKTNFDKTLRDRILIFEDTDNDGRHDKRTVFADNLQNLTSIELGYGGVYATAAPYLLWIPDRDGDDKPDAPSEKTDGTDATDKSHGSHPSHLPGTSYEILLDGFDAWSVRHNFVNGLRWGPDGWLYGRHGIQATSKVGAPGTPDAQRVVLNCCIWRFHPVRRAFEVVCWGGTNPWGLDWNAEGEGFFTNTVIGHCYHLIPGAHYERMYGQDLNPHIYQLLPQTADHHHFDTGKGWTNSRDGKANDLGGGHSHSGCMIYLGENWPAEYRGKLFTTNLHGRRINCERLERKGSSYVAKHEPDFAFFGDPWFRGVELTYGPDGGVYVLDWSDQGECHENDGVHRESGRIYKIAYGETKKNTLGAEGDLAKWSDKRLVEAVVSKNEWLSRQARQQMATRAGAKSISPKTLDEARAKLATLNDVESQLRMLWAVNSCEDANPQDESTSDPYSPPQPEATLLPALKQRRLLDRIMGGPNEYVQGWAIRLLIDWHIAPELSWEQLDPTERIDGMLIARTGVSVLGAGDDYWLHSIASDRVSPFVLRVLIQRCRRMPRYTFGEELLVLSQKAEADSDSLISNLIWQAAIFSGEMDSERSAHFASHLFKATNDRLIRRNSARYLIQRINDGGKTDVQNLIELPTFPATIFPEFASDVVEGFLEGAKGRRTMKPPHIWPAFAAKAAAIPALAGKVRELNAVFGDGRALDEIRAVALDTKADLAVRRQALESLIGAKAPELRATLETLAKENDILPDALRGLAAFDDAAGLIVSRYRAVKADARPGVIGALCGTAAGARALLDAIAAGSLSRGEITPYHARQIATLAAAANDKALAEKLTAAWGEVRSTPDDKKRRIAELKRALTPEILVKADLKNGRTLFTTTCATCHQLYDIGGNAAAQLGPNLTGSGRDNLDYLLENMVDPSAVVPADFKLSVLTLKDGRVLSGFIAAQTADTLTLRTMTETTPLARADVVKTETIPQSLMPEGQLDALTPEQIRDLVAFLMRK